ncbi:CHAT domain-containing protein [Gordonia sp. AC31]|uniref:CHAT domain-containing protein n=1 Tax=Gordonia sp. AC31 TaxID=2962571 RepID=UPI002881C586|nr:CHAT domain-containing protein [Gordonia sp. AC31]MDT0219969.1 CHAT domain-containing protein [Gordonia sp. AC31]
MPTSSELLLLSPGSELPVIHVFDPTQSPETGVDRLGRLMQEASISPSRHLFPPAVPLARTALVPALERSLSSDLEDIRAAAEEVANEFGSEAASRYANYLSVVAETADERAARYAIANVFYASDADRIHAAVLGHPAIGSRFAVSLLREELHNCTDDAQQSAVVSAQLQLAESVSSGKNLKDAVAEYLSFARSFGKGVLVRMDDLIAAAQASDATDDDVREALDFAVLLDHASEAVLSLELGRRLAERRSQASFEEAEKLLLRAVELLDEADPDWSAAAGNLAIVTAASAVGDPEDNWDRAHDLLVRVLDRTDRTIRGREWALNATNLSHLLMGRPSGRVDDDDLTRAIELAEAAQELRSPDLDVVDWAFSCVNVGSLYQRRSNAGDLLQAEHLYRAALGRIGLADHEPLWCRLRMNLASVIGAQSTANLPDAERLLEATLDEALNQNAAPETVSEITLQLASVKDRQGDSTSRASDLRRDGLALIDPLARPLTFIEVGQPLAEAYAQSGQWVQAAEVFDWVIAAHNHWYRIHLNRKTQREIMSESPTLTRWASYAYARAGRVSDAIEVIEDMRARELNFNVERDMVNSARLAETDPQLASEYDSALREHKGAIAADATTGAYWEAVSTESVLRSLLMKIRLVPGFENVHRRRTVRDIAESMAGRAVAYIVNAPAGTMVLSLNRKSGVSVTHIPEITSALIIRLLLFDPEKGLAGLLMAQQATESQFMDEAISRLDQLRPMARALAALLSSQGHELVVVPTGYVGLLPLYALNTAPADRPPRLLDEMGTLYIAPSALVMSTSMARAQRKGAPHLVGVANPTGDLPGAEAEVDTITAQFVLAGDKPSIAYNASASRTWLLGSVAAATHLHLACHGGSEIGDPTGGYLVLSGGSRVSTDDLSAQELPFGRLVVASACQTAHYGTQGNPDEVLGLPTGFLIAGAPCVVASLWPVDDTATALLMTRFYELLDLTQDNAAQDPVNAMRGARSWLRQLTSEDERVYVGARPFLSAALRRLATRDDRQRAPDRNSLNMPSESLYAKPRYWSAFAVLGA